MYNKKSVTFSALDNYFLNTATMKLNVGYLLDCIYDIFDIEYRHENGGNGKSKLFYILTEGKKDDIKLILDAFRKFADHAIENEYINSRFTYTATEAHLIEWLKQYECDISIFDPLLEELEELRKEQTEMY